MSVTLYREEYYRDCDLMAEVRRMMREQRTGELVLHLSQGRVLSVTMRERVKVPNGTNGNGKHLDTVAVSG